MTSPRDVDTLIAAIAARANVPTRPLVVAIDGRSGSGKSTLAAALAAKLQARCIEGDDFYAGGTSLRHEPAAHLAACCIDWTRQREVLLRLRQGEVARWRAFDWEAFDGRLADVATTAEPAGIILMEGVYTARSELSDLIDLRVLVVADDAERITRLRQREGEIGPWERQWHAAEDHYFKWIMPVERFDIVFRAENIAAAT